MPFSPEDATDDRTNKNRWSEVANYLLRQGSSYSQAKRGADRVTRSALARRMKKNG